MRVCAARFPGVDRNSTLNGTRSAYASPSFSTDNGLAMPSRRPGRTGAVPDPLSFDRGQRFPLSTDAGPRFGPLPLQEFDLRDLAIMFTGRIRGCMGPCIGPLDPSTGHASREMLLPLPRRVELSGPTGPGSPGSSDPRMGGSVDLPLRRQSEDAGQA